MFAKADVITVKKDSVLAVPKEIITTRRGNKIVFAVDRSSAEEKIIETGISDDQYTEVVKGLNKGEKVVVKGMNG